MYPLKNKVQLEYRQIYLFMLYGQEQKHVVEVEERAVLLLVTNNFLPSLTEFDNFCDVFEDIRAVGETINTINFYLITCSEGERVFLCLSLQSLDFSFLSVKIMIQD